MRAAIAKSLSGALVAALVSSASVADEVRLPAAIIPGFGDLSAANMIARSPVRTPSERGRLRQQQMEGVIVGDVVGGYFVNGQMIVGDRSSRSRLISDCPTVILNASSGAGTVNQSVSADQIIISCQ